jgi:hypothetical protein
MHVFQRGALVRGRIVRFAVTLTTVLLLGGLTVLVAGVVLSDGGPVLPAFVGPLQRVLAPPPPASDEGSPSAASPTPFRLQLPSLPFFSSAPTPTPAPTATTTASPKPAGPANSPPAATPRNGPPSSSPSNGPPSTFPGRTPPPRP